MGKSKTCGCEAELDTCPPNAQTVRRHCPALRDSVLDDDFCHAGRGHLAAGDATQHFPNILKRPPIPVVLALAYLTLLLGAAVYFVFMTQR